MELTNWKSIRAKLGLATIGRPALIGLAAIVVMVAVFAGRIVIDAATATEITIQHDAAESEVNLSEELDEDTASASPDYIFVHVSGAVKDPGLVKLSYGSRVADAIEAAGGFSKKADDGSINLARKLEDGEHIQVFEVGKQTESFIDEFPEETSDSYQPNSVNINSATEQELQSLPGIGPATASKIIEYRNTNGPFSKIDELKNVSGIGDKKFESIASMICI